MALRVLLVDDEQMILQGMKVLIDWEAEGCTIIGTASTGKQALEFLKQQEADLVFCDIKMPEMTGIELLQAVYEQGISKADFVILSGYSDFRYVQTALRYQCLDYMLKPVRKADLLEMVRRASRKKDQDTLEQDQKTKMERACLVQYMNGILRGKATEEQMKFVSGHLRFSDRNYYVHILMDGIEELDELSDEEIAQKKEKLYSNLEAFLGEGIDHCIPEIAGGEDEYEMGFIFCDYMTGRTDIHKDVGVYKDKETYLRALKNAAEQDLGVSVVILVGKNAPDINSLAYSYRSACMLRSFRGFQEKKEIYFYEEDFQVNQKTVKVIICKDEADQVVDAVRLHKETEIKKTVDGLFKEMEDASMGSRMIAMNIDYLLFQLIHLAFEIDESIEQETVIQSISDISSDKGTTRGSRSHLRKFCCAYSDYLAQLRKNSAKGILGDIAREVQEHYSQNLTLRELGQKYYINSSYLGQIFRTQYGESFKDYLNGYRIRMATEFLLNTDDRILDIAGKVGYQDVDYFVRKFIEAEGCTPTKYRKKYKESGGI